MDKVEAPRDYSPDFQPTITEKRSKRTKFEFLPKTKNKQNDKNKDTIRSNIIERHIKPKRPDRSARVYKSQRNNKPLVLNEKDIDCSKVSIK